METLQEAQAFLNNRGGVSRMRPFIGEDGGAYVLNHTGGDPNNPKNYSAVPVNNATLRYDEWRTLDEAVIRVAEQRLIGFQDLRRNGLVRPLANPMATTVLTWEEMSDAGEANISIDPQKRGANDAVDFTTSHIPIPVIYSDYTLSDRVLQESRVRGNGLDAINAERAARKVAEKLEDMLFGSTASLTYGGGTIHSYISHPDNNDIALGKAWDESSKTPAEIKQDVLDMIAAAIADKYYGPYMLYVPTAYETVLDDDYSISGASMKTIRQRIMDINSIQGIQVVDRLAANTVLLVTMNKDVVDLVDGMGFKNVAWDSEGGFVHNYKVMTIQVPRVKSDYENKSGIVVLS